jgi:tetratricopeptide (TPR) repeat protein
MLCKVIRFWYDGDMRGLRSWLVLTALLLCVPALAQNRVEKAKHLYGEGKRAYEAGDYQKAYDSFKEAYLLSHEPALLYNVSSALQGLRRPHEAAEALRSFLRLRSDDPERPQIEERIRALEEEQRLLDLEKKPAPPPPAVDLTPRSSAPLITTAPPTDTTAVTAQADEEWRRNKRKKVIGAVVGSIAGAIVVGTAIGLAVAFGGGSAPPYSMGLGPYPGTR